MLAICLHKNGFNVHNNGLMQIITLVIQYIRCVCLLTNGLSVLNNGFMQTLILVIRYICMLLSTSHTHISMC